MKIRAFIALKIPAEWEELLAREQERLKKLLPGRGFRWVSPEQIHITLRFLGGVGEEDVPRIAERLDTIARQTAPFELGLSGLGYFPSARRARVLWAGLRRSEAEMNALHEAVNTETAGFGEPPERRPFTPHLTLARIKEIDPRESRQLETALESSLQGPRPWLVKELLLMRSHLSSIGSRYEIRSSHSFAGGRE